MIFNKHILPELDSFHPRDFNLPGSAIMAMSIAYDEFMIFSKGEWSLDNYQICISYTDDMDYMSIAFLPDPAYEINGIPFEVASRGMYKNGRGVEYIYSLMDFSLVKKILMR
ncbi:hypothetical protein [Duganella sp. Root198D2]|uniref:hypothetical protein n=1 Tax=Duganella sp. Root198D2 TaxID=1736489 RepID=UPI0012E3605A|nr:hypothetical protein [Duganella sp. Root198D2]